MAMDKVRKLYYNELCDYLEILERRSPARESQAIQRGARKKARRQGKRTQTRSESSIVTVCGPPWSSWPFFQLFPVLLELPRDLPLRGKPRN